MSSDFWERQKEQHLYEITSFGGAFIYLLAALIFLILKNYPAFERLLLGIALIYAAVLLIKMFYFKDRPKKYSRHNFIEMIDASSFPSVHSARSAFLALFLMKYFNNLSISVLLAFLVVMVAYSRVYFKKHDLKDVSAGIVLGILAYFALKFFVG